MSRTRVPRRRTVKPAEQRRRELLDATASLLSERDFGRVTVEAITGRARAATGTFYRFFATKDDVLVALRDQTLTDLVAEIAGFAGRVGTDAWWQLADQLIDTTVGFWFQQPELSRVVLGGPPQLGDAVHRAEAQVLDLLAAGIELGITDGVVQVDEPRDAANLILHAATGLIYHLLLDDPRNGRRRATAAIRELVHKYLASAGP